MLDSNEEAASRTLPVNAVCACEGRNTDKPRAHLEGAGEEDSVKGRSATGFNSSGTRLAHPAEVRAIAAVCRITVSQLHRK